MKIFLQQIVSTIGFVTSTIFNVLGSIGIAAGNSPYFTAVIGLVILLITKDDLSSINVIGISISIVILILLDGLQSIRKAINKNTEVSEKIVREQQVIHLTEGGSLDEIIKDKLAKFRSTTNKSTDDDGETRPG